MNPPLPGLPAALAHLAVERSFDSGDVVFRLGAAARHVHFLAEGGVTLSRFGPQGEEVAIHAARAGEFFAEASLHSERYHCTAVVAQPALVASIPSGDLQELLRSDAEFAMQWLAIVSRQLRQARTRVERLCLKGHASGCGTYCSPREAVPHTATCCTVRSRTSLSISV